MRMSMTAPKKQRPSGITFKLKSRTVKIQEADSKDKKGKSFLPVLYRAPGTFGDKFERVGRAQLVAVGPTNSKQPKLKQSCLQDDQVLLLDTGFHLYVWVGKSANPSMKSLAVHHADVYCKSQKRPMLPVDVVKQNMESAKFSDFFSEDVGGCCMIM